jgi:two-component system sensor histidine kinase KdpD
VNTDPVSTGPVSTEPDDLAQPGSSTADTSGAISRTRTVAGWMLVLVGLPALTAVLDAVHPAHAGLSLEAMLYLSLAIAVALVGGLWPALAAAVLAAMLCNYFFTPPVHRFTVSQGTDVATLVVFVVVAGSVATVVDSAARRRQQAMAAEREAGTLAMLNRTVLGGEYDVPRLLALARDTFGASSVDLVTDEADLGHEPDIFVAPAGVGARLVLRGSALGSRERSIFAAFASHVGVLREREELARQSLAASQLAAGNRTRTALLAAVSHDLRTPLAGLRSAAETLRTHDQRLAPEDRRELLEAVEASTGRLTVMISDLLDLSRLQTGAVVPVSAVLPLREVVDRALVGLTDVDRVRVAELPSAYVDTGLLERVIANLVANALRFSDLVEITGTTVGRRARLSVVDHGPGVPAAERGRLFEPFQRLDDTGTGIGLGLAVARGLTEAQGGELDAADTPGGGLTMVLDLPGASS